MSVHFKTDAHTTSIAQNMHHTFIRWGCQPLETVKTVWPSGLRRWLKAPFRKAWVRTPQLSYFTGTLIFHIMLQPMPNILQRSNLNPWSCHFRHAIKATTCNAIWAQRIRWLISWMPGWVGLVLGRDFNSRGMETCRGSIPPLRR
jgi:hypothetical protein